MHQPQTARSSSRGRHQQQHEDPYAEIIANAAATGKRYRKTTANLGEENSGPWMRAANVADYNRLVALAERTPGPSQQNTNNMGSSRTLTRKASSSVKKRSKPFLLGNSENLDADENQYHNEVAIVQQQYHNHNQDFAAGNNGGMFAASARKHTYRHHRLATAGSSPSVDHLHNHFSGDGNPASNNNHPAAQNYLHQLEDKYNELELEHLDLGRKFVDTTIDSLRWQIILAELQHRTEVMEQEQELRRKSLEERNDALRFQNSSASEVTIIAKKVESLGRTAERGNKTLADMLATTDEDLKALALELRASVRRASSGQDETGRLIKEAVATASTSFASNISQSVTTSLEKHQQTSQSLLQKAIHDTLTQQTKTLAMTSETSGKQLQGTVTSLQDKIVNGLQKTIAEMNQSTLKSVSDAITANNQTLLKQQKKDLEELEVKRRKQQQEDDEKKEKSKNAALASAGVALSEDASKKLLSSMKDATQEALAASSKTQTNAMTVAISGIEQRIAQQQKSNNTTLENIITNTVHKAFAAQNNNKTNSQQTGSNNLDSFFRSVARGPSKSYASVIDSHSELLADSLKQKSELWMNSVFRLSSSVLMMTTAAFSNNNSDHIKANRSAPTTTTTSSSSKPATTTTSSTVMKPSAAATSSSITSTNSSNTAPTKSSHQHQQKQHEHETGAWGASPSNQAKAPLPSPSNRPSADPAAHNNHDNTPSSKPTVDGEERSILLNNNPGDTPSAMFTTSSSTNNTNKKPAAVTTQQQQQQNKKNNDPSAGFWVPGGGGNQSNINNTTTTKQSTTATSNAVINNPTVNLDGASSQRPNLPEVFLPPSSSTMDSITSDDDDDADIEFNIDETPIPRTKDSNNSHPRTAHGGDGDRKLVNNLFKSRDDDDDDDLLNSPNTDSMSLSLMSKASPNASLSPGLLKRMNSSITATTKPRSTNAPSFSNNANNTTTSHNNNTKTTSAAMAGGAVGKKATKSTTAAKYNDWDDDDDDDDENDANKKNDNNNENTKRGGSATSSQHSNSKVSPDPQSPMKRGLEAAANPAAPTGGNKKNSHHQQKSNPNALTDDDELSSFSAGSPPESPQRNNNNNHSNGKTRQKSESSVTFVATNANHGENIDDNRAAVGGGVGNTKGLRIETKRSDSITSAPGSVASTTAPSSPGSSINPTPKPKPTLKVKKALPMI